MFIRFLAIVTLSRPLFEGYFLMRKFPSERRHI